MLMILFIMLTGGTALAAGTGSTGSGITAKTVYTYEDDAMKVTATLSDGSAIPTGSTLKVDALTDQTTDENVKALYTDAKTMIDNQAANEKYTLDSFAAYNIYFKKDDNTYVPSTGTMTLEVTYKAANAPEAYTKSTAGGKAVVVYQKTQIKDILGNSTYILSNLGTAKDADQKDIISKKELDESGNLKALTFKESTYLPVILAWTENNAQAAANGAVTPTPTAAPSVTAAPTAEPSTTADENTDTTVTPTAEPSATAAPSTTVENGNDSATDKADAANNTVNKDDFTLGDNQTTNESLVDGSTGSGILTDNTAKGVTSTDANGKKIKTYTYKSDDVTVTVTADDTSALPDGAVLKVTPQKITEEMQSKLDAQAIAEQKAINSAAAYDISFLVNGVEVEPTTGVNVSVTSSNVKAGDQAAVYHVDDQSSDLQKVDASVNADGKVEFNAKHFSSYVITNTGTTSIKVTIKHYGMIDGTYTKIYSDDIKTLNVGDRIDGYNKAANWTVHEVEVTTNTYTLYVTETKLQSIKLTSDATLTVYYTADPTTISGQTTFYDYWVEPITGSGITKINDAGNYNSSSTAATRFAMGTGWDWQNTIVNGHSINIYIGAGKTVNQVSNGILSSADYKTVDLNRTDYTLSADYKTVNFTSKAGAQKNLQLYDPGVFSDNEKNSTKTTKKVFKDYSLDFTKTGDTYALTDVKNSSGTVVASSGQNFFPLDNYTIKVNGKDTNVVETDTANTGCDTYTNKSTKHNDYFGMRYDVTFSIGDYVGPLNYTFTGDDDLWVILDGKTVVLDIGGIHDAISQSVDLWTVLGGAKGTGLADSSKKNDEHRLTILYMERGANESNCQMNYTLPNAQVVEVVEAPKASLTVNKQDKNGEPLSGAVFKLVDKTNSNYTYYATSDGQGQAVFTGIRIGEYTMTETTPPDGYTASTATWDVKVILDASGTTASATMYDYTGTTAVTDNKVVDYAKDDLVNRNLDYNKTATVTNWDDRTYDINLTATSKASETKNTAADVMMVLDRSGSMSDATTSTGTKFIGNFSEIHNTMTSGGEYYYGDEKYLMTYHKAAYKKGKLIAAYWSYYNKLTNKDVTVDNADVMPIYQYYNTNSTKMADLQTAATSFVTSMASSSALSKVGMVSFSDSVYNSSSPDYALATIGNSGVATDLNNKIKLLEADGGTSPNLGLNIANSQLTGSTDGYPRYVILFTDGAPTGNHGFYPNGQDEKGQTSDDEATWDAKDDTKTAINNLKGNGVIVFTVGLGLTDNTSKWLTSLASKDTKGNAFAYTASNSDQLEDIFASIQSSITNGLDTSGVSVKDTIDSNFDILDDSGHIITTSTVGVDSNGKSATLENDGGLTLSNGGTVKYDSTNKVFYVTWENQTVANENSTNTHWNKHIFVKAKTSYIGGNNVATNVQAESTISVGNSTDTLPQPKVNVKANLLINDASKTIFWGESTSNTSTDVFNTSAVQGIINEVKQTYSGVDSSKLNITWYTNSACTDAYKVGPATISPETDVTYYAQVTYDAGAATDESNANTTLSGTSYKNGDGDSNLIYALNSTDVTNKETTPKNYGTYAIHVVKGQIQITKTIDNQYSNIGAINSNQTFVFKIQRYNLNADGTGPDSGSSAETFYETINFNANQTEITKSKIISQLKKGWYVVTEEASWSPKYTPSVTDRAYARDYAVGVNKGTVTSNETSANSSGWGSQDIGKTKFTGLEINSKTNKNATQYATYAVNVDASGYKSIKIMNNTFTNTLKSNWNWLSDTAAAVNQFTKTRN